MEFTVKRSTWGRGGGAGSGYLRRRQSEMMCCMGHVCSQMGVPHDRMVGRGRVDELWDENQRILIPIFFDRNRGRLAQSEWIDKAYAINDDDFISDAEREAELGQIFVENGHTLTFVD